MPDDKEDDDLKKRTNCRTDDGASGQRENRATDNGPCCTPKRKPCYGMKVL